MNIEELMKDEAFVAQLQNTESLEDIVKLLAAKGIDVTAAQLEAAMNQGEGELDEDALDDVAGGSSVAYAVGKGVGVLVSLLRNRRFTPILPIPRPKLK